MEKEKLCLRCMRKIGNNTTCPYCRNEASAPQESPFLPLKTVVGGHYLIGKVVSSNGEGFTYNAFDLETKKPVTLREFFPNGLVSRGEGNYCLVNVGKATEFIEIKDDFCKLWDKMANLKGYTALTPATDFFEDLGTVYAVTEFLGEGKTLREYLLDKEQGYISWEEARVLFMPVISALDELHASGIIHGAVSPTNLVIDTNSRMRIVGLSTEEIRTERSTLGSEIFDGYAAVEQYGLSSGLSEATDVYGFAAVLYRALIGSTPISASSRLANDKLMIPGKFAEQLPAYVINALVNALQILPEDRTGSFEALRDELSASPTAQANGIDYVDDELAEDEPLPLLDEEDEYGDEYEDYEEEPKKKRNTAAIVAISAAVSLLVLIVVLLGVKIFGKDNKDVTTTEPPTEDSVEVETDSNGTATISLPNFVGKKIDEFKNNKDYAGLLEFETEYVDDEAERGRVISQSINAGTVISALNPRKIVLKISNGLEVPVIANDDKDDFVEQLKALGFKNVRAESTKIAANEEDVGKVYSVVYENPKTGKWAELPGDRRLSSGDTIIVYYYGSDVTEPPSTKPHTTAPTTTKPTTTEPTTAPTTAPTTESTSADSTDVVQ